MLRTNTTCRLVPEGRERWSATLELTDSPQPPEFYPMDFIRLHTKRLHYLQRIVILFVLADLASAKRPLHWRDALYAWNAHCARTNRRAPLTEERFWSYLQPALNSTVIAVTWSDEDGNTVEPGLPELLGQRV